MYEFTHWTNQALHENVGSQLKHIIMEKIDLFDRYIRGEMTSEEESLFKQQLADNAEIRTDFQVYSVLIAGICKEEQQDNIDFAYAMKSLSEKELKQVIGKRERPRFHIRQIGMWVASVAAMAVICFSVILRVQHSAEFAVDEMMVEHYSISMSGRGGDNAIDISNTSQDEVEQTLPNLCAEYNKIPIDDIQAKQMAGINLAMAYLKIHNRKNAISILEQIKSLYSDDTEFVSQCDKILKRLK